MKKGYINEKVNKMNKSLSSPKWFENFVSYLLESKEELMSFREFVNKVIGEELEITQYDEAEKVLVNGKVWSWEREKNIFVWLWGKGSGKGTVAVALELYAFYSLLSMRSPQRFFRLLENDEVAFVNVALSGEQSRTNIFSRLVRRLLSSNWFKENYTIYHKGKVLSKGKRGEIVIGNKEVVSVDKNIKIYSENSEYEHWEGKNIVFFVIDEFSGCKTQVEIDWGKSVLNSLITSNRETPYVGIVMSYMRLDPEFDLTAQLCNRIKSGEIKNGEASIRFTWEMRPSKYEGKFFIYEDREGGVNYLVPLSLRNQFMIDEDSARRKYLCVAGRSSEVGIFLEKPEMLAECIVKGRGDKVILEPEYLKLKDRVLMRYRVIKVDLDLKNYYVIAIDKGEKVSDTALAIGHKELVDVGGEVLEKVVIDATVVWRPEKDVNLVVDTDNVSEVLLDILKYLPKNNVKVRIDHWQSSDLVNKCLKYGYRVEQKNASLRGYRVLKSLIENKLIEFPDTPNTHQGRLQLKYLRERGDSKPKVSIGKQDIVDVWAELCEELVDLKMMNVLGRVITRQSTGLGNVVGQKERKEIENFFIHPFFVSSMPRGRIIDVDIFRQNIKRRFER